MGPQKFIAANTAEALKLIRTELGSDAMVLSTKDTDQGVEIIAITSQDLANLSSHSEVADAFNALKASATSEWLDKLAKSCEVMAMISTPWSVSFVDSTIASEPNSVRINFKASAVLAAMNF